MGYLKMEIDADTEGILCAGNSGYAYTASEVEGVVNALYGDPSRVQEANQWLTAFQDSTVKQSQPPLDNTDVSDWPGRKQPRVLM